MRAHGTTAGYEMVGTSSERERLLYQHLSQNKEMNNGVWHHFKAFLIKHQDAYHTIAFICPNTPDSVTIAGTAQSVNTVESLTGYDFFGFWTMTWKKPSKMKLRSDFGCIESYI